MNETLRCTAEEVNYRYPRIKATLSGVWDGLPLKINLSGNGIPIWYGKKYRVTIEEVMETQTHPCQ